MQVNNVNGTNFGAITYNIHQTLGNGEKAIVKLTSTKPQHINSLDCFITNGDKLEAGFGMKKAKGFTEKEFNSFFERIASGLDKEAVESLKARVIGFLAK